MYKYKTLIDIIEERKHTENKGITFIEGLHEERFLSYKELYLKAHNILQYLRDFGLRPKDELVFQIENNEKFIILFWACILGGIIPVPVSIGRNEELRLKVFRIWAYLNNPYMIVQKKHFEQLKESFPERSAKIQQRVIWTEDILNGSRSPIDKSSASLVSNSVVSPLEIAFIQFSSGSTGDPKGVMLTHKNLITNITDIANCSKITTKDANLTWMPLTHDMGLIGVHLTGIFVGINQFLMNTKLFIRRPLLWIKKVNEHRATLLYSPNFGFKYFLSALKQTENSWDLSCVRLIYNGAEPISFDLCHKFLDTLSPYGLKKNVMYPVYGLAEGSLAISFPVPGEKIRAIRVDRHHLNIGKKIKEDNHQATSVTLVDTGSPITHCSVRITDADHNVTGDDTVGHIEIKGDNVTRGYYNNQDSTAKVMRKDGWLNTGDIGFMRNGHLFITGRAKDIIFVNGENYYSHDLERVAEELEGVELGKIVAAGVPNKETQEDEIIFFVIFKSKDLKAFAELANALKHHLHTKTGLTIKHIIPVIRFPKTTSGKVQRFKLTEAFINGEYNKFIEDLYKISSDEEEQLIKEVRTILSERAQEHETRHSKISLNTIISLILKQLKKVVGYTITALDKSLLEMGIESMKAVQIQKLLQDTFQLDLPVSLIFDYPTINKIADYILKMLDTEPNKEGKNKLTIYTKKDRDNELIAVIGMACRFPGGADTPEKFWENLKQGVDAVEEIPSERWDIDRFYEPSKEIQGKMYTKYGGFLNGIDKFDPEFFGISPKEAHSMDPQQRILLEVCWEAIENAGLRVKKLEESRTGVFVGISSQDYVELATALYEEIGPYSFLGSMHSTASGRISYTFGFQGPTMSIDTACSSALVAVNQAILSIRDEQCDLALAGGVNLILSPKGHIGFSQLKALSPDGRCKTFDESANGYGRSEGCGIVVLKRLSDAVRDGDPVLAVIAGSAMNHDGRSAGLTVPNGISQEQVILAALRKAGIDPMDVHYVETHGSGTKLGDPQEVNALANVFKNRSENRKLQIGSVKTNIGHIESAAGIAGMIKVILALQKGMIPKHLYCQEPNSLISWEDIPIEVVKEPVPWPETDKPRIAGVSSFGISGTNAHVILKEAPVIELKTDKMERSPQLLAFSGKDPKALLAIASKYVKFLSSTEESVEDICYTSNVSRTDFEYRMAIIGESKEDFVRKLTHLSNNGQTVQAYPISQKNITFLFTGQGSQYIGMGRELYETTPVFRTALEQCDRLFRNEIGKSVIESLYAEDAQENLLNEPIYAQPAIFSIEYALSQLWRSYGVHPSLVIGHSIGEYAAACIAGIFTLEDAVKLVAIRAQLMQSVTEKSKMVGILASEEKVQSLIDGYGDTVSIAAVNTPENVTISGSWDSIEEVLKKCKKERIFIEYLPISHAFHSVLMEPYIEKFQENMSGIKFSKPRIPIISTMTGEKVNGEMSDPGYWSTHIRNTVRFYDAMKIVEEQGYSIFIEIGGTATLTGLAAQFISDQNALFLPSLRKDTGAWEQLLSSLSQLYVNGAEIDWEQFHKPYSRKKVLLPNYPFQRERYWIKELREDHYEKIHALKWEEKSLETKEVSLDRRTRAYVIFMDQHGIGEKFEKLLSQSGASCFCVRKSNDRSVFQFEQSNIYSVDPCSKEDLSTLFKKFQLNAFSSVTILYLWGLDTVDSTKLTTEILHREQQVICTGLIHLIQHMAKHRFSNKAKLCILTKNAVNNSTKNMSLSQSTLWGIGRVIGVEYPDLWNKLLDIDDETLEYNPETILEELDTDDEDQVSLRDRGKRYVLRLRKMKGTDLESDKYLVRDDSTYLITGGLGGLGLLTAEWMVKKGARHIVLTSRKGPKASAQQSIDKLKENGAEIVVMQGDVSKKDDIRNIIETINRTMPKLRGIIHAAGIIDVGMITEQSWERLENVFAPKVDGGWNLHKATENIPLDFFIMYSSTASTGNMGESSYAGANMFLNALASYRSNNKLPALTICWQPWANIGMTASDEIDIVGRLTSEGFYSTRPNDGLKLLEILFSPNDTQPYIFDVDWGRYGKYISHKQQKGIFSGFCKPLFDVKPTSKNSILEKLEVASPEYRIEILNDSLRKIAAEVMGFKDYKKVAVDKSLREQGLDSLMSVQLRNRLADMIKVELSVTLFFYYPTIEQVSTHLLQNILTFKKHDLQLKEELKTQTLKDFENLLICIDERKTIQGSLAKTGYSH